jgi:hypothetical protein
VSLARFGVVSTRLPRLAIGASQGTFPSTEPLAGIWAHLYRMMGTKSMRRVEVMVLAGGTAAAIVGVTNFDSVWKYRNRGVSRLSSRPAPRDSAPWLLFPGMLNPISLRLLCLLSLAEKLRGSAAQERGIAGGGLSSRFRLRSGKAVYTSRLWDQVERRPLSLSSLPALSPSFHPQTACSCAPPSHTLLHHLPLPSVPHSLSSNTSPCAPQRKQVRGREPGR